MPVCCAILTSNGARRGFQCNKWVVPVNGYVPGGGGTRCGMHHRAFHNNPAEVAVRELNAYYNTFKMAFEGDQRTMFRDWADGRKNEIDQFGITPELGTSFPYGPIPVMIEERVNEERVRRAAPPAPVAEVEVFNENGEREVVNVPVPPEPAPEPRRNPPRAARAPVPAPGEPAPVFRARAQRARRVRGEEPLPDIPPGPPPPIQRQVAVVEDMMVPELAQFARDRQNVHTIQSVNMTKAVVERVLRIPVPEEYRWNMNYVSKTAGEIIADCKLTAAEMIEMMNRYIRDDDVYDMGKGIYGKVLDGVWQYIRNSENKADMCVILKQELKDNIGMCAQGNLTRLCNVLAGYLEGIGPQESQAERLGRELPLLMEIENVSDRITKAKELMREVALPEAEWQAWLDIMA